MRKKMRKKMRKLTALLLMGIMLIFCVSADAFAMSNGNIFRWYQSITGNQTDGEYLTKILGLTDVTRESVIETIEENWTEGLKYSEASYSTNHNDEASCVNYGKKQYEGREQRGYGYNCTGFVASVLYYANGGSREDALDKMNEIYLPLKQGRSYRNQSAFTDGTGWYYFFSGEQYTAEGKVSVPKTKIYYIGETGGPDSIQSKLKIADMEGVLKEGYLLFFWPSTGWDCHIGIYAGKDENGVYEMYHAAGRGDHNGVTLTEAVTRSPALSEGASYLYIVPLPEEEKLTGWQEVDGKRVHFYDNGSMTFRWYKEGEDWYYFDPYTGEMATGLKWIGKERYYFLPDGRMARYIMVGNLIFDKNGVCVR